MEEFTGITLRYCPDGHAIAQNIQNNNPGNVFLINIHQGGYANPGNSGFDFRTPFGNAIAAQSRLPTSTLLELLTRNSNALE